MTTLRACGLGALLFCLFALTGCINVEEELTIGKNGSVYYNGHITLGMTKMMEGFAGGGLFGGGGKDNPLAMNPMGGLDAKTMQKELKIALKPYKALEKKIKGLSGVDMNVWNDRGVIHIASAAQCKTMQVCLKYLAQAKKLDAVATGQGGPPFDAMFPRATFALKGREFSFRLPVAEFRKKWKKQMEGNPLLGGVGAMNAGVQHGGGEAPAMPVAPDPADTAPVLPPPEKGDPPKAPDLGNPFDLFGGEGGMEGMMVMMFGASHYRLRVNLPGAPKKTDSLFRPSPQSVVWEIPLSDLFFGKEKKPKDFTGKVRY